MKVQKSMTHKPNPAHGLFLTVPGTKRCFLCLLEFVLLESEKGNKGDRAEKQEERKGGREKEEKVYNWSHKV